MNYALIIGLTTLTLLLTPTDSSAQALLAGVAVNSITLDTQKLHVPLAGYGERENAPAQGVHDLNNAKALILQRGQKKFALVTVDLVGVPRSLRDEVLLRITNTGISSDNLMLAASHTHASVEMAAMNRNNTFNNKFLGIFNEKLLLATADKIAAAIIAANEKFQPVRIGTTAIEATNMSRNRRGDKTVDDTMTVMRIDKLDGSPLVIFVNYTAHPTIMGPEIMHVTSGWPGYLQRELEGHLGQGIICMYTNGAEGDIRPAAGPGPSPFARAERYGRKLANFALQAYDSIKPQPDATFRYASSHYALPKRTVPPSLLDVAGPEYGLTQDNVSAFINAIAPKDSYLQILQIGDLVSVSIPGEMAAILGKDIKNQLAKAGATHPIIIGLANEWISYILPTEEYHQGGYEPGVSFYGETLGPVIVEQAVAAGRNLLTQEN